MDTPRQATIEGKRALSSFPPVSGGQTTPGKRLSEDASERGGYNLMVVSLLMVAYLFSFLDRQILVLMIEPIQRDMELNDTLFSLLHGTAFAIFYAIVGLFMGRLVDNRSRRNIIVGSIVLWSAATAFCGLARNFAQLFVSRMCVGIGEAGLGPGTYSMVSDLYEPRKRAMAFSVYSMGIYLGTGLAFVLGGKLIGVLDALPPVELPVIGTLYSWQLTFLIVGLPGVVLALAIRLLVKEPQRGMFDNHSPKAGNTAEASGFRAFFDYYRQHLRAYLGHNLGFGLHMMFCYSIMAWLPVYFLREHQWSIAETGLKLGLILLIVGPLATLSGGYIANRLLNRGIQDAQLRCGAFGSLMLMLAAITTVSVDSANMALFASAFCVIFIGFPSGLNAASLQTVTPPCFRGQAAALFMLIGNLLGLGLGPLLVASITDFVYTDPNMLGSSLFAVAVVVMPASAALLWWARKDFNIDLRTGAA